jgi:pSer/pThr/pTyr-binding forkhead associated (FHA) protein
MAQIQITRVPLTIGRRVGNDVVLNVDNSMGVSGQHAKITYTNGRFFVVDEGSTYGSTLNGQTLPKGMPTPIEDGAILGFGPKVKLQFRLERSA